MILDSKIEEEVLSFVQSQNPKCGNFIIRDIKDPFLDGVLISVYFDQPDGTPVFNRVYKHGLNTLELFRYDELLLSVVGATHKKPLLDRLISFNAISGIMAISFTGLILILIYRGADIPVFLSGSFATILGFYFGRETAPRA